jgi:glycosyltransferase involved in cell wall biosynthesis
VETLSRELVRLGHAVTVVTLQTGNSPAEETIDGIKIVRIRGWSTALSVLYADSGRPFHPTAPDPGAMAALRRVLGQERPDIVHSHGWLQYSYAPLYSPRRGPGHVVTLHDYGLVCAKKTLQQVAQKTYRSTGSGGVGAPEGRVWRSCTGPAVLKCISCSRDQYGALRGAVISTGLRASRFLNGRADRYIAISTAVGEGSLPGLSDRRDIAVVPTMVPNSLQEIAESTPRPPFLPPVDGYLMFVGALGGHKGVDVLLEAWRTMRNRVPLLLIGTPQPDEPPIDERGVTVVHRVPSAQVMAAWARASVAVVPSVWDEPMGQVAIEAMLAGLPVVASDVGGLRDLVEDGVTGRLVPPGRPRALADALDDLLDEPSARRQMGAIGRRRARQYEVAVVAPKVVEVFEDVLLRRSAASRQLHRAGSAGPTAGDQ